VEEVNIIPEFKVTTAQQMLGWPTVTDNLLKVYVSSNLFATAELL